MFHLKSVYDLNHINNFPSSLEWQRRMKGGCAMSRFLLRFDLTLNNLLDQLEGKIEDVIQKEHEVSLSDVSKKKIREAIREVLSQDMLQSDLCGFSIYCSENASEVKPPEFNKKSDDEGTQ